MDGFFWRRLAAPSASLAIVGIWQKWRLERYASRGCAEFILQDLPEKFAAGEPRTNVQNIFCVAFCGLAFSEYPFLLFDIG
jgi:hypothetical protein